MPQAILDHLMSVISGGMITAVAWIIKSVYRAKRDIDFAHHKIRILEERFKPKEQKCQQ